MKLIPHLLPASFFLSFTFFGTLHGQPFEMTTSLKRAHQLAFSMRCDEAAAIIQSSQKQQPQNLALAHVAGWNVFLEVFIRENRSYFNEKLPVQDSLIDWVEEQPGNSQGKFFVLGELYLLRSVLATKFGDKWRPALDALSAHKNLQKMQKAKGDFPEGKGIAGAFELALASLPDNYKIVASMLGLKGSLAEGKKLLKQYEQFAKTSSGAYVQQKAAILSVFSQHYFEYPSVASFANYAVDLKSEPLLTYLQATILMEQSNGKAALEPLQKLQIHPQMAAFHHLEFMEGKALLSQLNPDAVGCFTRFLSQSDGAFYKHAAYRYLAWSALLWPEKFKSKAAAFQVFKEKASNLEKPVTGVDKQAMRDFNEMPFLPLLRARLLFDGGQYTQALGELHALDATTVASHYNPYWYRKGRVLQKMNQNEAALEAFEKMRPLATDFEYANGLLQQGLILEVMGKTAEALSKVNQLLALNGYPNVEGLQTRAKAAQQRLQAVQ